MEWTTEISSTMTAEYKPTSKEPNCDHRTLAGVLCQRQFDRRTHKHPSSETKQKNNPEKKFTYNLSPQQARQFLLFYGRFLVPTSPRTFRGHTRSVSVVLCAGNLYVLYLKNPSGWKAFVSLFWFPSFFFVCECMWCHPRKSEHEFIFVIPE